MKELGLSSLTENPTNNIASLISHIDQQNYQGVLNWLGSSDEGNEFRGWRAYARGIVARAVENNPYQAIAIWQQLLDEQKEPSLPLDLQGRLFLSLGMTYYLTNQWDRALQCYENCLHIHRERHAPLDIVKTLINQTMIYYLSGAYQKVLAISAQIRQTLEGVSILERPPIVVGTAYNQQALACIELGYFAQAERLLEQCLPFGEQLGERWYGAIYENLGLLYHRQQNWDHSELYLQKALAIFHRQSENLFQIASMTYHQGIAALRGKQDKTKAEQLLQEALALATQVKRYEIVVLAHLGLAELYDQNQAHEKALAQNRLAVATVEALRANIMLPDDRAKLIAAQIRAYEQMVLRLIQQKDLVNAFCYAEMCKSRTLVELLEQKPLRKPKNVPQAWLDEQTVLREQLSQLYRPKQVDYEAIRPIEQQLDALRERIRLQDAEFASFKTVTPLPLGIIQQKLPAGAVLIEQFIVEEQLFSFVITQTTCRIVKLSLTYTQLRRQFKKIDGLNNDQLGVLSAVSRDYTQRLNSPWILEKLYQVLINPLGELIEQAKMLIIVPHGLLHYIPFHTLYRTSEQGRVYLNEVNGQPRAILYGPSATTFFGFCQTKPQATGSGCLAIGYNHDFLHYAEDEAESIVKLVGGKAYIGREATKAQLFADTMPYRYLHLACHGWFNTQFPLSSGIALTDGIVDISDILQQLALQADLVTLSACETGKHHILQGDELIGLARAFFYAGTPSVLVTQWVVDDLSTRLLMERFYTTLAKGDVSIGWALSEAQLYLRSLSLLQLREKIASMVDEPQKAEQALNAFAFSIGLGSADSLDPHLCLLDHPYYWGAFFVMGEQFR